MLIPITRGFADAGQQIAQTTSIGGSFATGAVALAPHVGLISAGAASTAIPLIGVGVAAVIGAIALIENSGCGQTCIVTADDANKIEPYLQQNLAGYFAGPRTLASQQAALANADYFLNYLNQSCGQPSLGNAGKRCISDRMAGGCTWKQQSAAPYPGSPAPGQCWNWVSGYRDPIANDPQVKSSPTVNQLLAQAGLPVSSGGAINWKAFLSPAALLGLLWAVS